jgi:(hydroxyamino)benzene mutase
VNVQGGGRQILLHGAALVLVGLVWGLVVPDTPHPRLALGAHIQLVSNGILFIVLAIVLLALRHSIGPKSVWVMVLAVWLTWAMALSEVANSWWGTTQTLPIAAKQAGVTGAEPWQELIVRVSHMGAGLAMIIAWTLLVAGLLKPASNPGVAAP